MPTAAPLHGDASLASPIAPVSEPRDICTRSEMRDRLWIVTQELLAGRSRGATVDAAVARWHVARRTAQDYVKKAQRLLEMEASGSQQHFSRRLTLLQRDRLLDVVLTRLQAAHQLSARDLGTLVATANRLLESRLRAIGPEQDQAKTQANKAALDPIRGLADWARNLDRQTSQWLGNGAPHPEPDDDWEKDLGPLTAQEEVELAELKAWENDPEAQKRFDASFQQVMEDHLHSGKPILYTQRGRFDVGKKKSAPARTATATTPDHHPNSLPNKEMGTCPSRESS